jgi:hypothetical protein
MLEEAYRLLVGKFKGVKKSREELVKFIIRKALAFGEEKARREKKGGIMEHKYRGGISKQEEKTINKAYLQRLF